MSAFGQVIEFFKVSTNIAIKRDVLGATVKGRYTPGSRSTISDVVATVQPLSGDELEILPEGMRSKRTQRFDSETEFKQSDTATGLGPDWIEWDGETWEVEKVETHTWGSYWTALCVKVGQ